MTTRPAPELETGDKLDHYVILEKIIENSSYLGYSAVDTRQNRHVSLKILRHTPDESRKDREMFKKMALRVTGLKHPNLVPFFEEVEKKEISYFVTDYVRGYTLQDWVAQDRVFEEKRARDWLRHTADALDYAAHHGVFHFDLKPANFVVNWDNVILICNIGLEQCRSCLHGKETWRHDGTVEYASPEHIRGEPLDMRSDMYSLGAMLFHLMTGQPLYERDTTQQMRQAHLEAPFPVDIAKSANVPKRWIRLMEHLTQKKPQDRPGSYKMLLEMCAE
jgi:serine/threonine-protein kinase